MIYEVKKRSRANNIQKKYVLLLLFGDQVEIWKILTFVRLCYSLLRSIYFFASKHVFENSHHHPEAINLPAIVIEKSSIVLVFT